MALKEVKDYKVLKAPKDIKVQLLQVLEVLLDMEVLKDIKVV